MRVRGKIRNQLISILVDTSSTHNFVNQRMAKSTKLRLQTINSLTVKLLMVKSFRLKSGVRALSERYKAFYNL